MDRPAATRTRRPPRRGGLGLGLVIAGVSGLGCQHGLVSSPCAEAPVVQRDDPLAGLNWLAGSWFSADGGALSEETWSEPRGGTMLGLSRTVVDGETTFFEYLRIEVVDDEILYFASPKGRSPTAFRLVELEPNRAAFENPKHDFPRRIVYTREGPRLTAELSGSQGGEQVAIEWSWSLRP